MVASGISDPVLDQRQLPNGLRILTAPMPHTRSVTVSLYVGAGSRYEQETQAGVSHLVEHLCFKGSKAWPTAQLISEAIESVGGVLNAGTDRELTVYYAKVARNQLELALTLICDIVLRPLFQPQELEKERNVILEELASVEDNPGQVAELALDRLLWPGHPLGRDVAGTPESVRAIPIAEAAEYRFKQYTPSNTLLSVAGAVDPEEVAAITAHATADWRFGSPTGWESAKVNVAAREVALHHKEIEQAHLMVGLPALSADHPDRFALSLLISALGEGMSSRLFIKLREELGLAYDVHAYTSNLRDTGAISLYLAVDPDNAMAALRAALRELGLLTVGLPAAEHRKVVEYAKGRLFLSMEDTRSVSSWYGGQALLLNHARTVDEVVADLEAVTHDDLIRVARDLIQENRLRLAIVGPFDDTGPFEQALGL